MWFPSLPECVMRVTQILKWSIIFSICPRIHKYVLFSSERNSNSIPDISLKFLGNWKYRVQVKFIHSRMVFFLCLETFFWRVFSSRFLYAQSPYIFSRKLPSFIVIEPPSSNIDTYKNGCTCLSSNSAKRINNHREEGSN